MLVGPRRQPSIQVVGPRGQLWWVLVALRGGCEKREAVTCDTAFVTPPNWDVSNCIARPLIFDTVSRISLIPFRGVCRRTYILHAYTCRGFSDSPLFSKSSSFSFLGGLLSLVSVLALYGF